MIYLIIKFYIFKLLCICLFKYFNGLIKIFNMININFIIKLFDLFLDLLH
jgi:hypothetical protein